MEQDSSKGKENKYYEFPDEDGSPSGSLGEGLAEMFDEHDYLDILPDPESESQKSN